MFSKTENWERVREINSVNVDEGKWVIYILVKHAL